MVGGHKTLFHWVHTHHKELGNLFESEPTATTAVCEGWMVWMDGWSDGCSVDRNTFPLGPHLTQEPQMHHEGCTVASGTRKHFFPIGLTYTPKLSQLVHRKGWMISGW